MSVRIRCVVSCDHQGCQRTVEATTRLELVHSEAAGSHLAEDIEFPVVPYVNALMYAPDPPPQWTTRDGMAWCPEHGTTQHMEAK